MAIREKTIEFAVPSSATTVVDATLTNLAQFTVFIPEASPTIQSAYVEIAFQDIITATGGTITEHRVALRLGAAGYTTVTELDDISNTGENIGGVIGPFNFTSHFTTNWTGTSMTCDIQVFFDQTTGTTLGMTNVSAKLYVTYTYDDTAATQIKTVRIPLESLIGALGTTAANFGTSQIPALDTFLPEASKVIRDWHIVIEGNTNLNNNTTDFTLNADISGTQAVAFGLTEGALGSDLFMRWIYKPGTVPDTSTTQNLRLWSVGAARCNNITATLVVTYQFALSGTTRLLNSIMIPMELTGPVGDNTTAEASRFRRSLMVVEPGTITLRQSAVRVNWNANATTVLLVRAGAQSYRTYTPALNVVCGMASLQHRVDSGAAQGAGITLARGMNTLTLDIYTTTTGSQCTNVSGYFIINYESDVPSQGIGAANTTVFRIMDQWDAALVNRRRVVNFSFPIQDANYWLTAAGFCMIQWTTQVGVGVTFDTEYLSGEGNGAGYVDIYADGITTDAEIMCAIIWMRGRDVFKRFPQDADPDRVDIETARDYRAYSTSGGARGLIAMITRHAMTWTVSGDITGGNGSLATDLCLVRVSDNELMQKQTLAAGVTSFSFTVYDNTEEYFVSAYQDDTLTGSSGRALAA